MAAVESKTVLPADAPTIRLLMTGKEVGSIIGKGGEIVKRMREESGARINITDGSSTERIVTIMGTMETVFKAFDLICERFEQVQEVNGVLTGLPVITLRLIIPASMYTSLIGSGGCNIKDTTGTSVDVDSEVLANSTERAVTFTGNAEEITQCVYHIINVIQESPPKEMTVHYRPKPRIGDGLGVPVIVAGGQAYIIQGQYAVPAMPDVTHQLTGNPLANLAALGLGGMNGNLGMGGMNAGPDIYRQALAALAGSQMRQWGGMQQSPMGGGHSNVPMTTQEMVVPNELVGSIIGKGGSRIAEMRIMSGAMIRISNSEDRDSASGRTITITGTSESVAAAGKLINSRLALEAEAKGTVLDSFLAPSPGIMKARIH